MGKMDEIGQNRREYKEIYVVSCTVFLVCVQIYMALLENDVDLFGLLKKQNRYFGILVQIIVQVIAGALIFYVIYRIVYKIKTVIWIRKHRSLWIQGTWLHIHEKNTLRIGIVEIKQDFYEIQCRGKNINLGDDGTIREGKLTTWKYTMGLLKDDNTQRDLMGYYVAVKSDSQEENDGMHVLTLCRHDANGYTNMMKGRFCDTFQVGKKISDSDGHAGILTLYKPGEECSQYLKESGNSLERLNQMILAPKFQEEPFVRDVKGKMRSLRKTGAGKPAGRRNKKGSSEPAKM